MERGLLMVCWSVQKLDYDLVTLSENHLDT
jgi:hypothetical protein